MTEKAISPLRRRLIEDMTIRRLSANTQHQYIRHVKSFADFVGRSLDKATAEDVHRYQLHLGSIGTTIPTVNAGASALRFFFKVTLKRRDLADAVVSVREPRRLPVVLSPEEVARLPSMKVCARTSRRRRSAVPGWHREMPPIPVDRASTVLRLSWTHYTTTVSRGVIALLFSLDNWWEVRSLRRRVSCEPRSR